MPRQSKSYADYMNLAEKKGLVFMGDHTPGSVFEKTTWRCKNCGAIMTKAYRSVKEAPEGCSCQRDSTKPVEEYYALAQRLGITFSPLPGEFPRNTKVKTRWIGATGNEVRASFHELGYGRISSAMQERLGIVQEEEHSNQEPFPEATPQQIAEHIRRLKAKLRS